MGEHLLSVLYGDLTSKAGDGEDALQYTEG